jgi:molybdopterin converting factor small subunit
MSTLLVNGNMIVTVKFTPNVRILTKTAQTTIDLGENARLSSLLQALATQYGERLIDNLYASNLDSIDAWAAVIVDGKAVPLPLTPQSDVKLQEGSVVVLMNAVGGG